MALIDQGPSPTEVTVDHVDLANFAVTVSAPGAFTDEPNLVSDTLVHVLFG